MSPRKGIENISCKTLVVTLYYCLSRACNTLLGTEKSSVLEPLDAKIALDMAEN